LKDFHLYNAIKERSPEAPPLYESSVFCKHDILNPFLDLVTDGDFRFMYWGPSRSATTLHSDGMNPYSWRYNVVGEKEWKFYRPWLADDDEPIKFTQAPGTTVFVPSTWKHEVVNTAETISLNHNWIAPCAVDLMFACLLNESIAVDKELAAWRLTETVTLEDREKMLCGACGMNITMFTLMLVRAAVGMFVCLNNNAGDAESELDLALLRSALKTVTCSLTPSAEERYRAVLGDDMASLLTYLIKKALK
jgi:hypothetical protein